MFPNCALIVVTLNVVRANFKDSFAIASLSFLFCYHLFQLFR